MPFFRTRHPNARRALRATAAVLGLALLAGCNGEAAYDAAGATLSGRVRVAPLKEQPPAGRVTVQVLPFSGLPVTIADGIYRRIRSRAALDGIDLVHRLEEPATWRVQGHFVALGQTNSTIVIFTYDIFDAAGRPVHRIVGQDVAEGADGDAWGAVAGDVQVRLADRFTRELQAWLKRNAR
jgi:hypothetical protein